MLKTLKTLKILYFCAGLITVSVLGTSSVAAQCNENFKAIIRSLSAHMGERAGYMKQVAAAKYAAEGKGSTPYTAIRELQVLLATKESADQINLPTYKLLNNVQLQMDMAKQIQAYWINQWNKKTPVKLPEHPSLTVLRDKLRAIDKQLYPVMASASPALSTCSANAIATIIKSEFGQYGIDDKYKLDLFYPMLAASLKGLGHMD